MLIKGQKLCSKTSRGEPMSYWVFRCVILPIYDYGGLLVMIDLVGIQKTKRLHKKGRNVL